MSERRTSADRRMRDRRRYERSAVNCQIRLLSDATPSNIVQGSVLDVSETGLRLTLTQPIAVGEKLLIEARRGTRVVCNVTAHVVRSVIAENGQCIVGCESILPLSDRQLSQLKAVSMESAGLAPPVTGR